MTNCHFFPHYSMITDFLARAIVNNVLTSGHLFIR